MKTVNFTQWEIFQNEIILLDSKETLTLLEGSTALLLKLCAVCIHSFGLYLITSLNKNGKGNVQMIYIMNLSITELIINVFSFTRNLLRLVPSSGCFRKLHTYKDVEMYSYILDYQLKFSLYMWMLFITIDRVCGVALNLRYLNVWSTSKAKVLVVVTWMVGISALVYISVMYSREEGHERVDRLFKTANCFVMVFDFSFVGTSGGSYIYIFYKYKQGLRLFNFNRFRA